MTDSANVELVRTLFAAWVHGDFSATGWADPSIEWVSADGPTAGSVAKGLDGMVAHWRDFLSGWKNMRVEYEDCREIDEERVLVLSRWLAEGRASGLEVSELGESGRAAAGVFHLRGGKVTRVVAYWSRDRALTDLGLAPEARAQ